MSTTTFKVGDPVEFEHIGRDLSGKVIEVLEDGKVRVKDTAGYLYRYTPENLRHAGAPKVAPIPAQAEATAPPTDSSNTNTNNQNSEPMAKKAPTAKSGNGKIEAEASASNPALDGQKKKIAALTCKKHQKIWLLHSLGLEKAEVMKLAGCNAGEISNVRKSYADKPEKVKEAEALLA